MTLLEHRKPADLTAPEALIVLIREVALRGSRSESPDEFVARDARELELARRALEKK